MLVRSAAVAALLVAVLFVNANAQFGNAGAVDLGGFTPGVNMPFFSVSNRGYNGRNIYPNMSSNFNDGDYTFSIVQISMEGVASVNGDFPTVDGVLMQSIVGPAPVTYPYQTSNMAPAFTDSRRTRNFGREVYADAVCVWDLNDQNPRSPTFGQPLANVQPGTQYQYFILVSWPAGIGQAYGASYNAGSTILSVVYTTN